MNIKERIGEISTNISVALLNKPTRNQDSFLMNAKNKFQFILLLSKSLRNEGRDVRRCRHLNSSRCFRAFFQRGKRISYSGGQ